MKKKIEKKRTLKNSNPASIAPQKRAQKAASKPAPFRRKPLALIFIAIAFIVIIVAALLAVEFVFASKKSLTVLDICGISPGGKFFGHTVGDEQSCKIQCRAQCVSKGYSLDAWTFTPSAGGCNSCSCSCIKRLI